MTGGQAPVSKTTDSNRQARSPHMCVSARWSARRHATQDTLAQSSCPHLASLMKRVTLSLLSLMFSSMISKPYSSAARLLATAPTPCSRSSSSSCPVSTMSPRGLQTNHTCCHASTELLMLHASLSIVTPPPAAAACTRLHQVPSRAVRLQAEPTTSLPAAFAVRSSVLLRLCHQLPRVPHSTAAGSCPPEPAPTAVRTGSRAPSCRLHGCRIVQRRATPWRATHHKSQASRQHAHVYRALYSQQGPA